MHLNDPSSPYPTLAQAIRLEDNLIRRFGRWALRFRTFDQELSRLFDRLVQESVGHRGDLLYHASRHLEWKLRLKTPINDREPRDIEHFFILAEEQAIAVLGEALALMREAVRFYHLHAVLEPCGSLLGGTYQNLGAFKEPHIESLQGRLDRLQLRRLGLAQVVRQEPAPMRRH